jgi:PAS domain S-box-containing protein
MLHIRDAEAHNGDMTEGFDPKYGELIFDHVPHGIFTVDQGRRITSFNRAAEEITGWHRSDVLGRRCSEVFRSSHCESECFLFNSMTDREARRDLEVQILRRDGKTLTVSVSTAAMEDPQRGVIGGVEMFRDLSEVETLRRRVEEHYTCEDVITKSPAMRGIRDLLPLVAKSLSTVLIEGEPGCGKEMVARAIHNLGPRADRPFVALNCGAIPDTLVESELFGHTRGAFTDAKRDRPGRFALAEGGTLLLDEVGELSPTTQVKLLRVLQEREYTPLGSVTPIKADVRILAATNRDLSVEVLHGRFRRDLFFRLNVVRLALPPLRSRLEDIPLLVDHFIARFNAQQGRRIRGVSERAMAVLLRYSFPGNVRELENAIEHAFVVGGGRFIEADDLPPHILGHAASLGPPLLGAAPPPAPSAALPPLRDAEAATIRACLARHGGSRRHAAEDLGISRNTLWRKMRRYGLD